MSLEGVQRPGFERLAVYRLSAALSDALFPVVSAWGSLARWSLGVQLLRAADSTGANLAEAFGRETDADRRRFAVMARGSAYELQHWLARAEARGIELPDGAAERAAEITRMLNGLVRAWS